MTRYILALAAGFFFGLVIVAVAVYYNPFIDEQTLSPLAVTDNEVMHLSYSAAATDALLYTNDGGVTWAVRTMDGVVRWYMVSTYLEPEVLKLTEFQRV